MASLPNPNSFEGVLIGVTAVTSQFPRPSFQRPERSMAGSLDDPKKFTERPNKPSGGKLHSMAHALKNSITPARAEIHDLSRLLSDDDADLPNFLQFHFNPNRLTETIKVNWNEQVIPGLSHNRLHYSHTESVPLQFDLYMDALQNLGGSPRGSDGVQGILFARQFLQSLCYPKKGAQGVKDGAPPRMLFYWPNFMSLHCVIAEQTWNYTKFATDGTPLQMTCSMQLKEIRDLRLYSGDVLRNGSRRNDEPPKRN